MSNARFSILQARAVEDKRITNAQFRALAALGMFGDKDGWCFPKLKTLADILGKSRQAVNHDLLQLCELGYVEIYPQYWPEGGRKNNLYRLVFDTCKCDIDTSKDSVDGVSISEVDGVSISEVDGVSISEVDALTPHANDPLNDQKEVVEEQQPQNVYTTYEQEIGQLTPMISDMLGEIEKDYPAEWFIRAVREARKSTSSFGLKYVEAILKRWKANGLPQDSAPKDAAVPLVISDGRVAI